MPNTNATPIPSLGDYRKRQQAAKDRAEERIAPPDVRAARAAVLERREAAMEAGREEAKQKTTRPAEVLKELLVVGSTDVLEEFRRSLPTLSTRQIGDIIGDVLTERRRARHTADIAEASTAPRKPAKAR